MTQSDLDIIWVLLSAILVLLMQAGFLCFESGLTRSKNAINVAMKNAIDFTASVFLFWAVGFGLMFGHSWLGLSGSDGFLVDFAQTSPWIATFFIFQSMFCATAATILSGAVAERMRFGAYVVVTAWVVCVIYPIFGHWVWGGSLYSDNQGWLASLGFIDFAGSTVVHSVGGWVALAALLVIGPRQGRFVKGKPKFIPASNLPLAMLGVLLFVVGWFGFNGGSTLSFDASVATIIVNTLMAAVSSSLTCYLLGSLIFARNPHVSLLPLNGVIAGLVAITASCHAVSVSEAVLIGMGGGAVMLLTEHLLLKWQVDDAVGAVSAHLAAGIWGTLAVGLFADLAVLDTGLTRLQQIGVQLLGILVCGLWTFCMALIFLRWLNRRWPLRVSSEAEDIGLNVSEHGAKTELISLLTAMEKQEQSMDLSMRMPVEPFTEVGQIASRHNQLMDVLEKAVAQTNAIVRDIRDGIVTFTHKGVLTSFNPGAESIFQYPATEVVGKSLDILFTDLPQQQNVLHHLHLGEKSEFVGRRQNNERFYMEVTVTESSVSSEPQLMAQVRDITDRRLVEEQLHQEKERAQITLESIADGVISTDAEGKIAYLNEVAEKLTGWSRQQAVGLSLTRVFTVINDNDSKTSSSMKQILGENTHSHKADGQILVNRIGQEYHIQHTAAPIRNGMGENVGAVLVFHDVTRAKEMEKQLSYQASHDPLTGLLNRRQFEALLNELVLLAKHSAETHVLCYLDLDQFKLVNDTCGHSAGDELLRVLARRFKELLRKGDTVARLGGDEFGIILHGCSLPKGEEIANSLRQLVQDFRFVWQGKQFAVGASIGLVSITEETESLSQLLSVADAACYAAKDLGRNRVHVYQENDLELARRRGQMQWVSRIREALDKDRLRLFCQPIALTQATQQPYDHYEIFVRMVDRDGSMVLPGAFLPAAERYDLIKEIDRWVVKNTLAWLGDHYRYGSNRVQFCAINLSGASIGDEEMLASIKRDLKRYGVPGELVCFEITETVAVANLQRAMDFIEQLKSEGCRFALDDFGSGLSSFEYLKNLPVDYLKIDGTFIRDIDTNPIDRAMVQSINAIGHVLGLKTIAEFVETRSVLEHLQDLGVDYIQGYLVGTPQPLEQLDGVAFMPR